VNPVREVLLWASQNAVLRTRLPRLGFVKRSVARFMPGESIDEALAAAGRLAGDGLGVTFTHLGENVTDLGQAAAAAAAYLTLLDRIDDLGLDAEISVKVTHLGLELDRDATLEHLSRLAIRSEELGRHLWIDMEASSHVDGTLDLYRRLVAEHRNTGVCLQAYLRRTWSDVESLLPLGPSIRLVKGAYREPAEVVLHGRRLIDEAYARLASQLIGRDEVGRIAVATHDTALIRRVLADAERRGLGPDRIEIQMLYGIRVADQHRLARSGLPVRTLISYGPNWYPWFMRRMAEKPSNVWLAARNVVSRGAAPPAGGAQLSP
jgi:proline dehydrogenase